MPMTRAASSTPSSAARRRPARTGDVAGPVPVRNLTLEHFEQFCRRLKLDNGRRMVLEPFQKEILRDYFDGVRETVALLPSGNAKTTLFAALALHHLLFYWDGDGPEVFIMASSRGQAGRMLEHVKGFITRSKLDRYVVVKRREVTRRKGKGFIEILASDADTADGIGPTLALIDELHRHKTTDLYDVAFKGLKKRQGRILHCSTAGSTVHSPLGELRARCLALPGLTRKGMHTYARSASGTLAFHEWALKTDDDMHNMAVVKEANPLSTITIEDLQAEHDSFKPWAWARFACGLWVAGEGSAISPLDIAAAGDVDVELDPNREHLLAVDLAWVTDCTGITAVQALSRSDVRLRTVACVEPTGDGTALREEQILGPIRRWKSGHPTCAFVVIDPEAGGRSLIEKITDDIGLEVVEHSQKNDPMCDAYARLDEVIRRRVVRDGRGACEECDGTGEMAGLGEEPCDRCEGSGVDPDAPRVLRHDNDPKLLAHLAAAAAKEMPDKRSKLVKRRKNPEHIDLAVSAAMGVRVALAELEPDDTPQPAVEVWA